MTRRLLLVLALPLLLAVGADQGVRLVAQSSLAGRLQDELGLAERPRVRLGGFPFLLHLARQRFPSAVLEADEATLREFRFAHIRLELRRVRFSFDSGEVSSRGGTGELAVDERGAQDYLARQGVTAAVGFASEGVSIRSQVMGIPVIATGALELEGRRLVFHPERVEAEGGVEVPADAVTLEIALPKLDGLTFDSVRVERGRAVVTASLQAGSLPLR